MCPIRNWAARSPLLGKGGAHTRSASARRFSARNELHQAIDEWLDPVNDESSTVTSNRTDTHRRSGPEGPERDRLRLMGEAISAPDALRYRAQHLAALHLRVVAAPARIAHLLIQPLIQSY